MARHLDPAVLAKFSQFNSMISSSSFKRGVSPFDTRRVIQDTIENRWKPKRDIFKTEIEELVSIPVYSMVFGIPNSAYMNTTNTSSDSFGSILYNSIQRYPRNRRAQVGNKTEQVYSQLQSTTRTGIDLDKTILTMYFSLNPLLLKDNPQIIEEEVEKALKNVTELPSNFFTTKSKDVYKGTYNEVHIHTGVWRNDNMEFKNWRFKDFTLSTHFGTIVDFENKKVLAMLTLNPDYLEYFLLHRYSGTSMVLHPDIFNVMVDEEFINPDSTFYTKELKRLVRKGIIDPTPKGVTAIKVNGSDLFNQLYNNCITEEEAALGPLEEIAKNNELQEEFISSTTSTTLLATRNITLNY